MAWLTWSVERFTPVAPARTGMPFLKRSSTGVTSIVSLISVFSVSISVPSFRFVSCWFRVR